MGWGGGGGGVLLELGGRGGRRGCLGRMGAGVFLLDFPCLFGVWVDVWVSWLRRGLATGLVDEMR